MTNEYTILVKPVQNAYGITKENAALYVVIPFNISLSKPPEPVIAVICIEKWVSERMCSRIKKYACDYTPYNASPLVKAE
ncbi:hypothetical protein XENTR_v10014803 [Xenopus tropicalis]|nr:hypothetical protein XENTR_v10014803 [Xenopus tropicalis]